MRIVESGNRFRLVSLLIMTGFAAPLVFRGTWTFTFSPDVYLPLHIMMELVAIIISFMIFTLGWATFANVRSTDILFLSVTSFSVGLLDLAHTLSFNGMPRFVTASHPEKAIYFWLAARITEALALVMIPAFFYRTSRFNLRSRGYYLLAAVAWTAVVSILILMVPEQLPRVFEPGRGLTPTKIGVEYGVVAMLLLAAALLSRRAKAIDVVSYRWLAISCLTMAVGEVHFTAYSTVTDIFNLLGHLYKILAFSFMYRAIFIECVAIPYQDMKRYAQEARVASETKTQFLANVSHEFRNPLSAISGFADLVLNSRKAATEGRKWIETIQRNAQHMRSLIDDLSDLSRAESGRLDVRPVRFRVDELLADITSSLSLEAEGKSLYLRMAASSQVPSEVLSDPIRLRQILVNLIGNAIKFTENGGVEVEIESGQASQGTQELRFVVRDTGIGIAEDQWGQLFQPFSRLDHSRTQKFPGTGLGLALSKQLAQILGGDLWLAESKPNRGAEFRFTIQVGCVPAVIGNGSKDGSVRAPLISEAKVDGG